MANNNGCIVTYRIVGRYLNGTNVTGYHLLGSDNSQLPVTKDRLIYLIGKGIIDNARVQANNKSVIIRGYGVNLNTLPVYNERTKEFGGNKASRDAANSLEIKKSNSINTMGQFRITKRIMSKTSCLGYILKDYSGLERKVTRQKVMELAIQKLICNAKVQKYVKPDGTETLILRGEGCELSSLPVIIVNESGEIIDTSNSHNLKFRAAKMSKAGILHNIDRKTDTTFCTGDYIVCGMNGELKVYKSNEIETTCTIDRESKEAICDIFLNNLGNYPIELFGTTQRILKPEQVKRWTIICRKQQASQV